MSFINFSRNPIAIRVQTANQAQPNFYFLFILKVYNTAGAVIDELTLRGVPDSTGEFVFDARPILHALLEPDVPIHTASTISVGSGSLLSWTADVEEWYGEEPAKVSTQRVATNKVLLGGLSFRKFPGNNFFEERASNFLSWAPANKLLAPDQPDFLYYLCPESWASIYLHAEVTYDDGSSQVSQIGNLGDVSGKMAIIPAGFKQLGLDLLQPDNALFYKLWAGPTADPTHAGITEKRPYLLDYFVYPHARTFLYQNSIGGFETIRCTGEFQETGNMERQSGERVLGSEYTPDEAQKMRFGAASFASISANTGMQLNRSWYNYLDEFFRSDLIFELQSGYKIPIVMEDNKYKRGKSNEYEFATDFEYSIAQIDNAYTP